jgi:hypothetical protein
MVKEQQKHVRIKALITSENLSLQDMQIKTKINYTINYSFPVLDNRVTNR